MGKDKGPFGVYDESFDLDRDGELNAVEFDYMMDEVYGDDNLAEDDDSYLFDDDEDNDFDDDDDWDDEDEDDDSWEDSEDDDWDDESDDY